MQMRRGAWHYRYLTWLGAHPNTDNLCAYFWHVVFALAALALVPVAVVVAAPMVGIGIAGGLICRRFKKRGPTLLGAWLRAKKAKICPRIEWV